jgi:tetratricopeptide (TPR) repeat protein
VFDLKPLSAEGIPAALEKAHLYRMLNQPEQAESICEDILAVEPDNQTALVRLLLAITDRFADPRPEPAQKARDLLPRLQSLYEREYYAGIICERLALARLRSGMPQAGELAYDFFREAMGHYERAEQQRPPANDDAILRWNSCARIIMAYPDVRPSMTEQPVAITGD